MSVQIGASALFRVRSVESATYRCESLTCEFAGVVTDSNVVAGIVLIGMGVLVTLAYVRTASEACQCERRRVLNEREAFEEFADRVEALDPVPAESSAAIAGRSSTNLNQRIEAGNTADITVHQVVSIYEETVMSVPHYEAEYNETVHESMAAELGPDTATSLATNRTLFPPAQHALVDRAREAAAGRTSLADAIGIELDALTDADRRLTSIDRQRCQLLEHLTEVEVNKTDAAIDIWNRLDDLETEAEELATERQQNLHEPPIQVDHSIWDGDELAFYGYLYGATDTPRHPLLSQIADLIATIREDRNGLTQQIADGG